MEERSKQNHDIIEYLISFIENSGKEGAGTGRAPGEEWGLAPLLDDRGLEIANCLKKFVDRMPGGFFIYHADGEEELIYANDAMIRMFNCKSEQEFRELTGNSFRGIVHPEDLELVEKSIWEQIANSCYDLDYVEYRIIQKGGGIRWIDDYGHFVRSAVAGDVFYVFAGDATEKKAIQLEEKKALLKENFQKEWSLKSRLEEYDQEHLRHLEIIEGLSVDYESIFYANLETNRVKAYCVSPRFRKQFPEEYQVCPFEGFDREYIREWVHPDDWEALAEATNPECIRRKLAKDKTFVVNYRVSAGEKISYMQLHVVDVGIEGEFGQVLLGYRNIDAEIKKALDQKQILRDALQEARLANDAKNRFLSNMSHDILTPMNAIVGFTALARKHIHEKEKVAEYLGMIGAASDQLLQLLNDVLEISKIESEQDRVEEAESNLIEIVQQIQKVAFPRAAAKHITLSMDISELAHPFVRADREKLDQILTHLVDNALKYTEDGGLIRMVVSDVGEPKENHALFRFCVEDDGIGINEEFQAHLFEPFEREKNTTFSRIHGTGLGLTIVKKLVDMMGGDVSVKSRVGEGSRFQVSLPLEVQQVQKEAEEAPMDFCESKRILLVDDNEINLEIEKAMLQGVGFLVETAEDGSIALDMMRQAGAGYYDAVLMDIQMPVMDGYHATRAIRALEDPALSTVPIIAVSANSFEEDRRKSLESGMNAHLPKPLDSQRLLELLGKYL